MHIMLVDQTNHNVFLGMEAFHRCIVQLSTVLGGSRDQAFYVPPGFCIEPARREFENDMT